MIQKTKVITLILFGLLFFDLSAQEDGFENDKVANLPDNEKKVRFGLQFSPNLSWFKANTEGYKSEGTKFGFSYGLSIEYFMTKNYLFSTGINILQTGGKLSYNGAIDVSDGRSLYVYIPAGIEAKYALKQIEVPLLLKLRTNEVGYLTYFGGFGFNLGFNYQSSADYEVTLSPNIYDPAGFNGITNGSYSNDNVSQDINWLNIGLVIGAGVEYNISGNTSLSLGLTFNNGFINQLDAKAHELDASGTSVANGSEDPYLSSKSASANLNYVALNIGIYF